jgi:hypothetical protein
MLSIYRLPNKLTDEEVVKVMRRDLFILLKKILFFIVLVILPYIFFYFIILPQFNLLHGPISYPLIVIGASSYYLFIWLFFFFSFIDYYLDVWVITNERIIDVQQRGFFSRIISEQKLFRIQDVTSEVHGIIPTLLRYGEVHVQTAGTKQRFLFHQVPDPDKVRDIIIKLVERNKKKHKNELDVIK